MPEEANSPSPTWSRRIRKHVPAFIVAVLALIVGTLILVYVFGVGREHRNSSEPSTAPSAPAKTKPKNRADEIAGRGFWLESPDVFTPVPDDFDLYTVQLDPLEGDVEALTPRELVDDATQYTDETFFIVGRITNEIVRRSEHGLGREITIVGNDPSAVAVIGAPDDAISTCCHANGDVIFALVRLAAIGNVHFPGSPVARAAYVVTPNDVGAVMNDVSFPIDPKIVGSHAIRARAEAARRR